MLREGPDIRIAEGRGVFAPVPEAAQQAQHRARVHFFPLRRDLRENLLYRAQLLGFVVDDEIWFVAELLDVQAQNAHAERVKGAERGDGLQRRSPRLRFSAAIRLCDPFPHFPSCFVGKRHRQDTAGFDAPFDQVCDAESNDSRLAGPGAGQDEHRASHGLNRLSLLRV